MFITLAAVVLAASPLDHAAAALVDGRTLPAEDAFFQRYVSFESPAEATAAVFTLNAAVSRSAHLYRPVVVGDSLLRVDLRSLGPTFGDLDVGLAELIERWERLADLDPYYHVVEAVKVSVAPYRAADGKTYSHRVIRHGVPAPHLGEAGVALEEICGRAAIVRADWLVRTVLSSIDGGLYYDFIGAAVERRPGESQLDAYLRSRGVAAQTLAALDARQRVGIVRSGITAKPRMVEFFYGATTTPGRGTGLVAITYDVGDADVRADNDPIRNLLEFRDRAREIILERPNGLHEFTLFDSAGNLQVEAPNNVAVDHNVPAPHTTRLQSGISCIRCHGAGNRAGWIPAGNDVKRLLASQIDLFGDLRSKDGYYASLQLLASMYSGEIEPALMRGRDTYSDAVFRISGGQTVEAASKAVADVYAAYEYDLVDTARALAEIGVAHEGDPVEAFGKLLPPLPVEEDGIAPEDPIIGLLKAGIAVNRRQWEQIFVDVAIRASE